MTHPLAIAPVFVVAAPLSGGRRLARWLSGPEQAINHWLDGIACARLARDILTQDTSDAWTREQANTQADRIEIAFKALHASSPPHPVEFANASLLRVAALAQWLPTAKFVFLYRDARESVARMLDVWKESSQPHPSNVQLPSGNYWNLTLPPGWSAQCERPLAEIVAWQWAISMRIGMDALTPLPADRWCLTSYDRLLHDPSNEATRLAGFLNLQRDSIARIAFAPAGRTSPDARVWSAHLAELEVAAPIIARQAHRAVQLFAQMPETRIAAKRTP